MAQAWHLMRRPDGMPVMEDFALKELPLPELDDGMVRVRNHYLSVDALAAPHVTFLIAEDDAGATGCAALARMEGYAEVKSMFVDPRRRGTGAGAALMAALEATARAEGIPMLRLETGEHLTAAVGLYRRAGFAACEPWGEYVGVPLSYTMSKQLT